MVIQHACNRPAEMFPRVHPVLQAAAEKAAEEEKRDLSDALEGFKPLQARRC